MGEEWIVRVQGKEYGPVDVDELRAWREDGRLIRENEVRQAGTDQWFRAGELPEVFGDGATGFAAPLLVRRLSFGEIFVASWRIYVRGFARFFSLALLVSIPSLILQLAAPYLHRPENSAQNAPVLIALAVAFITLMLGVIAWPFSIAGMQLLAHDLSASRNPLLADVLRRVKPLWPRMIILALIVYGSYFLWTALPLVVALSLAGSAATALSALLLMLLLLVFALYMTARLFTNFLFWQQAPTVGGLEAIDALRESKELARTGTERPRLQRPLYRGAIAAALWLLLILFLNVAIELPVVLWRLRGVTGLEETLTTLQKMATGSAPDLLSGLTTLVSCVVHAVLRPWLAAFFVVLYLDTKSSAG